MDQSRGLLANGFHDARMGMPQGIYPQSGHEIEITLSLEIIEKYARAALKDNRVTSVGLQQEAPFTINDPLSIAHSRKDCNCRAKWPEPCFEWCSLGSTGELSRASVCPLRWQRSRNYSGPMGSDRGNSKYMKSDYLQNPTE